MVFNYSETPMLKIRNPTQRQVLFDALKKRHLLSIAVFLAHRLNYGVVMVA
jgi:hypothetical protein